MFCPYLSALLVPLHHLHTDVCFSHQAQVNLDHVLTVRFHGGVCLGVWHSADLLKSINPSSSLSLGFLAIALGSQTDAAVVVSSSLRWAAQ